VTEPLLQARGIVKHYGGVQALRGADFEVYPGEVVALIGDNGAGKSTLTKVLSGAEHPDEGEIVFEGRAVQLTTPHDAHALGIETVYQDLALAPDLDPASNMYLGREMMKPGLLGKLGFLDRKAMRAKTAEVFESLHVKLQTTDGAVANLSGGQRQGVAVSRAVNWADKVIFMDEPTAALGVVQSENVLALIRRVRSRGVAVVLISHSMPQVKEVCDRVEVLRLGQRVCVFDDAANTTMEDLVGAMTGAYTQGAEVGR
jgi:simple sugar transport system ATP-binding protein